ncbi:dienelactone hydrolase family protein [Streptomyces griseoruber]|uniref:dienelactone hydrolase family protein n=1 Tax=Streptomyces griseoruber TaxID=1943 RepID=UPI0037A71777
MSTVHGTTVDMATRDGTADAYPAHPDRRGPFPAVLLYMDAFGLRPHPKLMADRPASAGYAVLVPNVFHRQGRAPVIDLPDFVDPAGRPELFQRLGPLIPSLTPELTTTDADAYLRRLTECPMAGRGPVGVTGYCTGAGLALRTAGTHPDRVAAAAGFHGANLASTAPDSPHLLADRIKAELYAGAHHGFTQADTAAYDPEAAERHWAALPDLFSRTL